MQPLKAQGHKVRATANETQLQSKNEAEDTDSFCDEELEMIQEDIRVSIAEEQAGLCVDADKVIAQLYARR